MTSDSTWLSGLKDVSSPSLSIILEAILLSASEPVPMKILREAVGSQYDTLAIQESLDHLKNHWQERGLELIHLAGGYRFRTRPTFQVFIERAQTTRAPRYSKSVMETLAVIVYRQPVTRADIENIRGVAVNHIALKTLEARGWIESLGVKRDAPGGPMLWGTTKQFLNDLGLKSLTELPPLEDIAQALEEAAQKGQAALPLEGDTMTPSTAPHSEALNQHLAAGQNNLNSNSNSNLQHENAPSSPQH